MHSVHHLLCVAHVFSRCQTSLGLIRSMQSNCSQLSTEVLKSIFDAAFIDTELDEDGDLCVTKDQILR